MRRFLSVIAGLTILLAALVLLRAQLLTVRPPSPSVPGQPQTLPVALDFDIVMYQGADVVGGNELRLSDLFKEGKPVVLNFWAGLCPPCRAEMPDFNEFYKAHGASRFILIGIDVGPFLGLGSREDGKALLKELSIVYPAGTTFDARTVSNYRVLGMPTTYFLTSRGRIFKQYTGILTQEQLEALTAELLKSSKP